MSLLQVFLCVVLLLFVCFSAEAKSKRSREFPGNPSSIPTLYVDPQGHGNFRSIQSAIDHIPSNNQKWIRVYVKAGVYRERIEIPSNKPYIYIQGEGKWKTRVVWDAHESIMNSATLISNADNIVIKSMTFQNSYNSPPEQNRNPITPALAAMITGDKCAFYRVAFLGLQDTLWDVQGRHYFKQCTIQGAIDFIFGAGQSIYERCSISVVAGALNGLAGYITAQGRSDPNHPNGFIFKDCNIFGTGKTYLGRPWREYARVVFYNTLMEDVIVSLGWDPWASVGREYQLTFAEHSCRGPGANATGRVGWESKLSRAMAKKLTAMTFIDSEGWIRSQAFHVLD